MTLEQRPQRNVWTYLQAVTPPLPKEGETWYDPSTGVARMYNGSAWEYYKFSSDASTTGVAGYAAGGYNGSALTSIERMSFINESFSAVTAGLTNDASQGVSSDYSGYLTGTAASTTTVIDKLVFLSDVVSTITSGMTISSSNRGAFESSTTGYLPEGVTPALGTTRSTLTKLVFSSEVTSALTSTFSVTHTYAESTQNSSNAWTVGDYINSGPGASANGAIVEKTTFSSEAIATTTAYFQKVESPTGCSSPTAGYYNGGTTDTTQYVTTIGKITFSTDANSAIASGMSVGQRSACGYEGIAAGYAAGGQTGGFGLGITGVERLLFSTEASNAITSSLTTNRYYGAGVDNA